MKINLHCNCHGGKSSTKISRVISLAIQDVVGMNERGFPENWCVGVLIHSRIHTFVLFLGNEGNK